MLVEQLYTNCLAQAAYYIESNGEAAVVDPIRDIEVYLEKARQSGSRIRYIFETHFHADFVSGHIDLAKATGAEIVYGPGAVTGFPIRNAHDGEVFPLGDVGITAIHTPGHTPESTCYLLRGEDGNQKAVFTGDTVFVGDVGRPDLCVADPSLTTETMAESLFHSVHEKLAQVEDYVTVYPGHGPGSACGKNLGPETWSTMGEQRSSNYALQAASKEEFVEKLLEGMTPAPDYFFEDARLNKEGYDAIEEIRSKGLVSMDAEAFEAAAKGGALVLDSRNPEEFETGFVPGALNIGLNGQYAIWAATLLSLDRNIILVCPAGKEEESVVRLSRVGFSNISGYLSGGMEAWKASGRRVDMVISVTPEEFALDYHHEQDIAVLDVRKPSEWEGGHLDKAVSVPLDVLSERLDELDRDKHWYVHCAGGYRSMIAASILRASGYPVIKNIYGGYAKIKETGLESGSEKVHSN